jgi:hypothetical protein
MNKKRPLQWYHSRADLIWPDSTFNRLNKKKNISTIRSTPIWSAVIRLNIQNMYVFIFIILYKLTECMKTLNNHH